MSNSRAVVLLRRLSTCDNTRKSLNFSDFNPSTKEIRNPFLHQEISLQKRFHCTSVIDPTSDKRFSEKIETMPKAAISNHADRCRNKKTNKLIKEKSPYLLQHSCNPVAWYPFAKESISKAKDDNKLIFLSIGFSTCHWCHQMEQESFQNQEIANILNKYFICIKVDREERPDIDRVYSLFIQTSSGYCGWPLNVFLTPDLYPIDGGTYYTPYDSEGLPGFLTLLNKMKIKWILEPQQILNDSSEMFAKMKKKAAITSTAQDVLQENVIRDCLEYFMLFYEPEFGGFGTAPKFPQISILNFIFHIYARDKYHPLAQSYLDMCLNTLTNMARGGIRDHVGGGFSRYSVDNHWHVPHFEKMLYDQAQIINAYTDAFLVTKNDFYAEVVNDTIKYVNRDLRHKLGAYYSAQDADSYPSYNDNEKKGGAYYVWEMSEIREILGNKIIKDKQYLHIFCDYFNIEPDGNVACDIHNQLENKNVLIAYERRENIAKKYNLSKQQFSYVMQECLDILYQARLKRPRPDIDTKIICSWNGMMMTALSRAGQALGRASFIEDAIATAKFIKKYLYQKDDQTLRHICYTGKDEDIEYSNASNYSYLEDYANVIKGSLELYEATLDNKWLKFARTLQSTQNAKFWDEQNGVFRTRTPNKYIIMDPMETKDGAEPAGNSISCLNLQRLAVYAEKSDKPDQQYAKTAREMAKRILITYSKVIEDTPTAMPEMLCALICYHDSPTQVLITGGASDPRTLELVRVVRSRLIPGRVLAVTDPQAPARTAGLNRIKGPSVPTAYVCRRFSCSLPVTDVRELAYLLDYPQAMSGKTACAIQPVGSEVVQDVSRMYSRVLFTKEAP